MGDYPPLSNRKIMLLNWSTSLQLFISGVKTDVKQYPPYAWMCFPHFVICEQPWSKHIKKESSKNKSNCVPVWVLWWKPALSHCHSRHKPLVQPCFYPLYANGSRISLLITYENYNSHVAFLYHPSLHAYITSFPTPTRCISTVQDPLITYSTLLSIF